MQPAGHLVGILVELPAGVQLGHDHFGGGDPFPLVNARRNPTPVVDDFRAPIGMQNHLHILRMPRQRLIDRVVHHLVDHMMEPGPVVRIPNIHPRPLPYRI